MERDSFSARWQMFGDAMALALGVNLWVGVLLLPALRLGGFGAHSPLLLALPLPLLALGIWRRSEWFLLLAFPCSLLAPLQSYPPMASPLVYGLARTVLVGASLVLYLFGASTLTSFKVAPSPMSQRALASASQPTAVRWRRRFRIYAALSLLAFVFPLALLYRINFDDSLAQTLAANYPGRAATFTNLLNVFAIALWTFSFQKFFLAPLKRHRSGDKQLLRSLRHERTQPQQRNRRLSVALFTLAALVLMALWLFWHKS